MRRYSLLVVLSLLSPPALACAARPVQEPAVVVPENDEELRRIAGAVEKALSSDPPRGYEAIPRGVRLNGVERRRDGSIVLDFSEDLLIGTTDRTLEDALHQILTAAADARGANGDGQVRFMVLVNGVTLDSYRP